MTKTKIPKLSTLITSHKFDWTNSSITAELFGIPEQLGTDFKLFHFDKYISSEDVIKEMEKEGYRAANIYELLSWKGWNDTDLVVALGSVGEVYGGRSVPCLYSSDSGRGLSLGWFGSGWGAGFRFLGTKVGSEGQKVLQSTNETCKHKINYCHNCGEKI